MVTTEQKLGIVREAGYSIGLFDDFLNTASGWLIGCIAATYKLINPNG